jgi:mercuric ion binding protein
LDYLDRLTIIINNLYGEDMKKLYLAAILILGSSSVFAKDVTITLEVPSMNCVTCPITVEKALEKVDGVKNVEVTYENKLAVVAFDDEVTSIAALTNATKNAGYPSLIKQ